jgi:[acyl-carrier-protein] S-malonyltransferase
MAAILGLKDEQIVHLCGELSTPDEAVAAANFNSPGQVVVAGHAAVVQRLVEAAKQAGAKRAVLLPVSVPSHCALMKGAADRLRDVLAATPVAMSPVRVIHNVDVAAHSSEDAVRSALVAQMCESVRWTETVQYLSERGVTQFIECGPGKVLTGLSKRIAPQCQVSSIHDRESLDKARESLS